MNDIEYLKNEVIKLENEVRKYKKLQNTANDMIFKKQYQVLEMSDEMDDLYDMLMLKERELFLHRILMDEPDWFYMVNKLKEMYVENGCLVPSEKELIEVCIKTKDEEVKEFMSHLEIRERCILPDNDDDVDDADISVLQDYIERK